MNNIKDKCIAIIGGGPGGLTLARLLQMHGADVKVYERDKHKDARAKGATLDLHEESGLKALEAAGLMDEFWANYRPGADKLRIMDKHASILFSDGENGDYDTRRPEIDRGPLQQLLIDSLLLGTIVWDSHCVSLAQQNGAWRIAFNNGYNAFADIVIAADGANSKVRPFITDVKPFYTGITAIEGAVYDSEKATSNIHKLLNGGKIFVSGDDKSLIISSKGDGSLVFYTSFKCDENWLAESGLNLSDKQHMLSWFKLAYTGWDSVYQELFEQATLPFITRPIYSMPVDQTWEALPNITMLGDAAHLMPPFAGEGVNMAMLDALELSQCLLSSHYAGLHTAIAAYEQQMRERASAVTRDSLESGAMMHSPDAIAFLSQVIS